LIPRPKQRGISPAGIVYFIGLAAIVAVAIWFVSSAL
jgi:hypothetical protein